MPCSYRHRPFSIYKKHIRIFHLWNLKVKLFYVIFLSYNIFTQKLFLSKNFFYYIFTHFHSNSVWVRRNKKTTKYRTLRKKYSFSDTTNSDKLILNLHEFYCKIENVSFRIYFLCDSFKLLYVVISHKTTLYLNNYVGYFVRVTSL